MAHSIHLTGTTWDHTRGTMPMLATAQRWGERHPDTRITWTKRSLQAFADQSIPDLAREHDLLILDHPSMGEAAAAGAILPLDTLLPAPFLADQAAQATGASHASYGWGGHQWALAVDAATPVAAWRADRLARLGAAPPAGWDDLMRMAKAGLVVLPAIPVDALMATFMLWLDVAGEPFAGGAPAAAEAIEALRALLALCDPACLTRNPIRTYEAMAAEGEGPAYCPFAYGYSAYAMPGFADHALAFGGLVTRNRRLRSTLGGAGLAISARCAEPAAAAAYAAWCASEIIQRGLWVAVGGQPGHRAAWLDAEANRRTGGYFAATLGTLDEAWLRPRWPGYIAFQDEAGHLVHGCLRGEARVADTARALVAHHARALEQAHV